MADTFDRELKELLEEAGCYHVRPGKGSNQIWHSPITRQSFPVPVGIKSRHTANSILKQAGIPRKL